MRYLPIPKDMAKGLKWLIECLTISWDYGLRGDGMGALITIPDQIFLWVGTLRNYAQLEKVINKRAHGGI